MQNAPSDNGENCLQSPVVDVSHHANLPDQIRSKEVIPKELPNNGWGPDQSEISIYVEEVQSSSIPLPSTAA